MRIVTVIRKPCVGSSVTQNVLLNQTGALNIDACRIRSGNMPNPTTAPGWNSMNVRNAEAGYRPRAYQQGAASYIPDSNGRWPANLILQHQSRCVQTGNATIPGYVINRWTDGAKPFGNGAGHEYQSENQPDEQIAVWKCEKDCPVPSPGYGDTGYISRYFKQVQGKDS